ncbi:hypothetical protein ColLi_09246 [Colletotrichum liriopes]|uniref:Uncharacterized protein n=1 Tax=Colletotrichum liriopes TaxID=708192 RepID=A0AA37GUM2_9PEZI|nr:hypothetical protein ColLi_09246 [Colletotrichum liriopes]
MPDPSEDSTLSLPRPFPSPNINTTTTDADTDRSKYIALQFSVRLQPENPRDSSRDAVQDANGPASDDAADASINLQTVNMTFDPDFSPSPLGPLNLYLRYGGTVAYAYDVVLLCRDVSHSTLNVGPRWYQVAATLTSSWYSSSTYAVFHLFEALKERLQVLDANDTTSHHHSLRFYNETLHSILHTVGTLFFGIPELCSTPSSFPQVVYNAADDLDSLQHAVARSVISLSLLVNILQRAGPKAAQRHPRPHRRMDIYRHFVPPLNATELALARIIPPYDHILPPLDTASALTWAIGFSRQLVGTVVAELQAQGNRTGALLAAPPPEDAHEEDRGC